MTNLGNKEVMAKNLKYYMKKSGITQKELSEIIGISTSTLNDWIKAKKYPRIDKIELLASYFGVLKSDLIEERWEQGPEELADITARILLDPDTLSMVENYLKLSEADQFAARLMVMSLLEKKKKTDPEVSLVDEKASLLVTE